MFPSTASLDSVKSMNRLAQNIRALRLSKGLSQRQLAERAGMATKWLQKLEASHGSVSPRLSTITGLCIALGVSIAHLVESQAPKAIRERPLRKNQQRLIAIIEEMDSGRTAALLRIALYIKGSHK